MNEVEMKIRKNPLLNWAFPGKTRRNITMIKYYSSATDDIIQKYNDTIELNSGRVHLFISA